MGSNSPLPYWQVNVPEPLRTTDCPEFLTALSEKDVRILSTPDFQYHVLTWPEVQSIIVRNRLDLFQRVPSELRRYLAYNFELKKQYGSVMQFILSQRLTWEIPLKAKGATFQHDKDIKILWNDWPYGIDARIVHLVVWTKFALEDDPATNDLTEKARREIEEFVNERFAKRMGEEKVVIWQVLLQERY